MSDPTFTGDTIVLLINCVIASAVVCLVAILLARATRATGPQWAHSILLFASVTACFLPLIQCLASIQGLGLVGVDSDGRPLADPVWVPVAISFWLTGVTIQFIRFAAGMVVLRRLRTKLVECKDSRLPRLVDQAVQHVGLDRSPQVVITRLNVGPMLLGVRRPVVVISRGLNEMLSDQQLLCVLVHELEHLRRRDVVVSALQQFISCFYWWNPFFHIANQEMDAFRERACDDRVVSLPNNGHRFYASALLLAAQSSSKTRNFGGPAIALLSRRGDLVARIERFTSQNNRPRRSAVGQPLRIAVGSAVILLLASLPLVKWDLVATGPIALKGPGDPGPHIQMLHQRRLSYMRIDRAVIAEEHQIAHAIVEHQADQRRGLIVDLRSLHGSDQHELGLAYLGVENPENAIVENDSNSRIVLLVDAYDTLSTKIRDQLAKDDLSTLIISDQTGATASSDWSRHGDSELEVDRQLLLAIQFLSHV